MTCKLTLAAAFTRLGESAKFGRHSGRQAGAPAVIPSHDSSWLRCLPLLRPPPFRPAGVGARRDAPSSARGCRPRCSSAACRSRRAGGTAAGGGSAAGGDAGAARARLVGDGWLHLLLLTLSNPTAITACCPAFAWHLEARRRSGERRGKRASAASSPGVLALRCAIAGAASERELRLLRPCASLHRPCWPAHSRRPRCKACRCRLALPHTASSTISVSPVLLEAARDCQTAMSQFAGFICRVAACLLLLAAAAAPAEAANATATNPCYYKSHFTVASAGAAATCKAECAKVLASHGGKGSVYPETYTLPKSAGEPRGGGSAAGDRRRPARPPGMPPLLPSPPGPPTSPSASRLHARGRRPDLLQVPVPRHALRGRPLPRLWQRRRPRLGRRDRQPHPRRHAQHGHQGRHRRRRRCQEKEDHLPAGLVRAWRARRRGLLRHA